MLGAMIHNINLPENHFEFLFVPLYAFDANAGRFGETFLFLASKNPLQPDQPWPERRHFSNTNKATDSFGKYYFENFSKLVPYVRLDFKPADPRSTISKWIDFKSYLITEQTFGGFRFLLRIPLIHPNSVSNQFRYVNS